MARPTLHATAARECVPNRAGARFLAGLFAPVDIASLVFFRISIGLIFLVTVVRSFTHGWVEEYLYPEFHFTYYGFSWVKPWPLWGLYAHFITTGLAALGLMLGLFYRVCAIVCFLGLSYIFLLEQSDYLNHFYLMCLLALLMIFIPAHRSFSLDARRNATIRSDYAPAWARWLLLAQLSIVYFYAGVAKLNPDWLAAAPLRVWLTNATDVPVIGRLLATELGYHIFAYGGLAFDLFVVPLLLWRRTRLFAYVWAVAFHLLNFAVFDIGVFPWMMILATLLYFPPDWPRRWLRWRPSAKPLSVIPRRSTLRWGMTLAAIYLLLQAVIPFRHLLYPGKVDWTEEGHRFSWRMMLNSKRGTIRYVIRDPVTKQTWEVDGRRYLTRGQYSQAATCPDMILQMAHFLARTEAASHNYTNPLEVRAISSVSLNAREAQPLIDPTINLAAEPRNLRHARWILPFKESQPPATVASQIRKTNTNSPMASAGMVRAPVSPGEIAEMQEAASRGDAKAQVKLADVLSSGRGGVTNLDKAFFWCAKAAEAGLAEAQYQTALDYRQGRGVQTNLIQAMKWATLAARQSYQPAMALQDELRVTLTPFQLALARRLVSDAAANARDSGEAK